jgi:alkanesulfonate monooxygenase SsuD/methylene tetrahydromethanopterin reductase-like flavin-dependent oxidoreductase (luciferase family)
VQIGLLLTAQHEPERDPSEAVSEHLALVRAARDAGLDAVLVSQHFLTEPYAMLQPMPLLGRLAAEAGQMRLGTGVLLVTLLNPVEVAEQAATLDVLTGGRFILGVGLGYRDEERSAFGVPERAAQVFVDKVDVIRRLLAGEEVTAAGPGYRLDRARLTLRPMQRPRPTIWMAANTDAGVRRAARNADAWLVNPHARVAELVPQMADYRRARGSTPYTVPVSREVCVAPTDLEAVGIAREHLVKKYASYVKWGQSDEMPQGDTLRRAWDDLRTDRFILGSPETVIRKITDLRERLGATELFARVTWPGFPRQYAERTIRLLGTKVLPALAR